MDKKNELKWVAWESTAKCNLNCVHCRSHAGAAKHELINTKKAKLLMDRVSEFSKPVFVLSGGEPLLRRDIFELAKYGAGLGFKMAMATNGSLINSETCAKLKESGIKIISLSLDGTDAASHDDFRKQKGSFDSVIKAARLFKENNMEFLINSSFTKRNQDRIEATYKLAKKLGAKAWYMFLVVPMGRGKGLLDELVSAKDYEKILKWHHDMEIQEKDMLVRPTCAPSYYRIFVEEEKKKGRDTKRRSLTFSPGGSKGCVAAQSIAYISAAGDVFPCSYFTASGGNIFKQPLAKIWDSGLFKSFRDYEGYDRCGICEYRNTCGGCRARAYIYEDNLKANDPYCGYVPQKMRKK